MKNNLKPFLKLMNEKHELSNWTLLASAIIGGIAGWILKGLFT